MWLSEEKIYSYKYVGIAYDEVIVAFRLLLSG
jgi:hypothetical protein